MVDLMPSMFLLEHAGVSSAGDGLALRSDSRLFGGPGPQGASSHTYPSVIRLGPKKVLIQLIVFLFLFLHLCFI